MAGIRKIRGHFLKYPKSIGQRTVLGCNSLKGGLLGIVLPLGLDPEKRVDEIRQFMSDVIDMDRFDCVPPGAIENTKKLVEIANIFTKNPRTDRFDVCIPLRRHEDISRYFQWNAEERNWEMSGLNFRTLRVNDAAFMLIVKTRPKVGEVEESESSEEEDDAA